MRLYNPNYTKNSKKTKRNQTRTSLAGMCIALSILAAIAVMVYLIVIKASWYYYIIDIVGGIILLMLSGRIFPPEVEGEYIDIGPLPDEVNVKMVKEQFPVDKVIVKSVSEIARENLFGSISYKGIFEGIAYCECGHMYSPQDISFTVSNRESRTLHTDNGNMYSSEIATVAVTCQCAKCGKQYKEAFYGVERSTGSSVRKHHMFTDDTTVTTKSYDPDYEQFVTDVYEQDKKRHEDDTAEYARFIKKKQEEMKRTAAKQLTKNQKRIAELKAKGWYEKGDASAQKKSSSAKKSK